MIERERLAISEISLARVADEYLTYIRSLASPDPEELAEFLVIASELMLIKSRSLLPHLAATPEEEASREDLERRLTLLKTMRDAARALQTLERGRARILSREAYAGMPPVFYPPPTLASAMLADAYAGVLALIPRAEKLAEERIKRIVSLEEKIAHIRAVLERALERGFSEIVRGAAEKADVVVSFLALLELARAKFVELRQSAPFEDIMIKRVP